MKKVFWHKINEFDFPQPYKEVLILEKNQKFSIGYYKGEADNFPWYVESKGYTKSSILLAWCELPFIPEEMRWYNEC